jgi:hypothetical protein
MKFSDVQTPPPPFSPGAPQFAPHDSNRDRGNRSCCHSQLGKPVDPLSGGVFRLRRGHLRAPLVAFLKESGPVGGPRS